MLRAMTPTHQMIKVGAAFLVLALAIAGCSNYSKPTHAPPQADAAPPPRAGGEQDEAASAALAAYRGYIAVYNRQARRGDPAATELRKFAADPLAANTIFFLQQIHKAGLVQTGEQAHDPKVTAVDVSGTFKTVTIGDCIDSSKTALVDKVSGSPAPLASPNGSKRTEVTVEAVRYDDGRWLVRDSTIVQGATC